MYCKFQWRTKCLVRLSESFYPLQRLLPEYRNHALRDGAHMQKRTKSTLDERNILFSRRTGWKSKVSAFRAKVMSCEGPLQKYDCLMNLRKKDRDLYYHYLCEYTGEVTSIIQTVDELLNKFTGDGLSASQRKAIPQIGVSTEPLHLPQNTNKLLPQLLNVTDAMDCLRTAIKSREEGHAQNAHIEKAVETSLELYNNTKEGSVPESYEPKLLAGKEPKKFVMYFKNGNKPKK